MSIFTRKAKVKKQLLKEVVENNDWKVNNKYDQSHAPLPVKEIIQHAELYIDMEVPYDVLSKNCEHFVTMLRYGEGVSDQARRGSLFIHATLKVASVAAASVGAVALTASGVGPVATVGAILVGATTPGGVDLLSNLRSSGRHSGNKRKSN